MQRRKAPSNPYHGQIDIMKNTINHQQSLHKSNRSQKYVSLIIVVLLAVVSALVLWNFGDFYGESASPLDQSTSREHRNENVQKKDSSSISGSNGNSNSHVNTIHFHPPNDTEMRHPAVRGSKIAADTDATAADTNTVSPISHTKSNQISTDRFQSAKKIISSIIQEFHNRYGGEEASMAMLSRGIIEAATLASKDHDSPLPSKQHTAERIILAMQNDKRFIMSFGGYSVTVGRGNCYNQSYPFVMERILKPVFEELDLELTVRNSAIGGIPSFPYGWCLGNFLGLDSDVVSWDYGMNEGNGAEAFESYIRQSVSSLPKRPMMIALDNKKPRMNMMKQYAEKDILIDSIAVGRGEVVEKRFLDMKEEDRPEGFQDWDKWGAPEGSPGQSSWHPKYKEHEMIGWMIAVHFLDVVKQAIEMLESDKVDIDKEKHSKLNLLPKPVSNVDANGGSNTPTQILYGVPLDDSDPEGLWHMDPVSCRTSFLPNISGSLNDIVISGVAESVGDDLQSRDDAQYKSGWVLDVGKVERDTKRKGLKFGGFGYIDMKNALYGIKESGTLSLRIPHEGPVHNHAHDQDSDTLATHWFDTIVFCEVNEKRTSEECKFVQDLEFIVGGVKADEVVQITNAAAYLKKNICVNVVIPKAAVVQFKTLDEGDGSTQSMDKVELSIDVSVKREDVSRAKGSCSISHVIWQSH